MKITNALEYKIHEIIARIKELRTIEGITEEEMAARMGMETEEYRAYERGEEELNFGFLYTCAQVFSVDVGELIDVSESTLYPILKRLEAAGQLTVYSMEHNGRLRKYYRITDAGRRRIAEFLEEWRALMTLYRRIEAQADGIPRAAHTGNEGKEGNEV